MSIFIIIDGSFPKQNVIFKDKSPINNDVSLTLKTFNSEVRCLNVRQGIISVGVVNAHNNLPTVKLNMYDGSVIIAQIDNKTLEKIKQEVALGAEEGKPPFVVIKKTNETIEAIVIGLKIGVVALIILFTVMWYIMKDRVSSEIPTRPDKILPAKILTPEEIAQQKKAREDEEKRREKAYRTGNAIESINSLKTNDLLLEGVEVDLKRGNINSKMDSYAIGAILEVIYSTAKILQTCWSNSDVMSPEDIKYLKSIENRLSSFQQRALPKMRLALKNQTAQVLWIHNVTVSLGGTNNTSLTLYGFEFALNANIQAAEEQLSDLATKLRFKKIMYATDEYAERGTSYRLDTPSDSTIADYNGEFHKLDRKSK